MAMAIQTYQNFLIFLLPIIKSKLFLRDEIKARFIEVQLEKVSVGLVSNSDLNASWQIFKQGVDEHLAKARQETATLDELAFYLDQQAFENTNNEEYRKMVYEVYRIFKIYNGPLSDGLDGKAKLSAMDQRKGALLMEKALNQEMVDSVLMGSELSPDTEKEIVTSLSTLGFYMEYAKKIGSLDMAIRDLYEVSEVSESDEVREAAINAWRILVGIHDGDLWADDDSQIFPKGAIDLLKLRLEEISVIGVDDPFLKNLIRELNQIIRESYRKYL